jgi:hypothetical protein
MQHVLRTTVKKMPSSQSNKEFVEKGYCHFNSNSSGLTFPVFLLDAQNVKEIDDLVQIGCLPATIPD